MKTSLSLARAQKMFVYDAAYLELALRRGLPIGNLDSRLKTAAIVFGVATYSRPRP